MHLALLPCSNAAGRNNLAKTVERLVSLEDLLPYLTPEEALSASAVLPTSVAVWGATPAANGANATKWERMETGDVALFYRDSSFILRGEIAFKTRNARLAKQLWGEKGPGETWEYMYFLTRLKPINIDIRSFNIAASRSLHRLDQAILSFDVLTSERSELIMTLLGLEDSTTPTVASSAELTRAEQRLASLPDDLDRRQTSSARVEQNLLRKVLLSNRSVETCSVCGSTLPVDLLVIGHILKRSQCSPQQRKDRANVMPVCLLGCDSLFEKGYVYVDCSGFIRRVARRTGVDVLEARLEGLADTPCEAWNEQSEPYFKLHRDSFGNR